MYRQQFLDYLDRYDSEEPRELSIFSSTPQKQFSDNDWFRKPPAPSRSQSSSFSAFSQSSIVLVGDESVGKTRQEGEQYLSTPRVIQTDGFDVLAWWSANESFFPRLAQVAKDILAIPITQVGVERVFNTARDVIGDRRHRLSTQTIRQIMILKDTFSKEEDEEEGTLPYDEVDDLLELPACVVTEDEIEIDEVRSGRVETDRAGDSTEEEPVTPSRRQQRPRKRVKPLRYRINDL